MFRITSDAITENFMEASLLRGRGVKRVALSLLTDWLWYRRADWAWLSHLFIRSPWTAGGRKLVTASSPTETRRPHQEAQLACWPCDHRVLLLRSHTPKDQRFLTSEAGSW